MASKKQVVPMEGDGSTTTTVPWTPTPDTTEGGGGSNTYDAFMQQQFDKAYGRLRQMSLKDRIATLKLLRSKGFGTGSEVSRSGLEVGDVARFRELLIYATTSNITQKQALLNIDDLPNVLAEEGARRKTNIKDVDSVFTNVVVNMIGRQPTKTELEKFRAAYAGMEAGDNAPTVQAAAEAQLKEKMPDETKAAQFADYATMFEQMLRGG